MVEPTGLVGASATIQLLIGILLTVCGAGIGWVLKITSDIRKEVRVINGRLIRIEEWKLGKERLDEERHHTKSRRLDKLENKGA